MYLKESGRATYFSECGIIAVVARATATGDRASTVRLLASEEASLDIEVWEGIVICGAELCKATVASVAARPRLMKVFIINLNSEQIYEMSVIKLD